MEQNKKLVEAILNSGPETDGLPARLEKKDKELSKYHNFESPFRKGFLLAEDIVKEWVKKHFPL